MTNDTHAPTKGIASATVLTFMFCLLGYFACNCGTGCKSIDIGKLFQSVTNAIPQAASTTTTTQPPVTVPQTPDTPSNSKPRPSDDMTVYYVASGTGIDVPAISAAHWHFPDGNAYESGKGYERIKSASWSIVGTNYPATYESGYLLCTNVHASGLINPISLTIIGELSTWEYTIWQPSVSPKRVTGKKIK